MKKMCEVSYRQVWVGVFVAALAPAATLPSVVARFGPVGWLGVVLIIPLAPLYLRLIKGLGTDGLAAALKTRWGFFGRCVLTVYYLWAAALAALTAGGCVDRLARTDYGELPSWLVSVALAGVAAYLIYKGRSGFLRGLQVFFLALVVMLGLFFVLGAMNLDGNNLRPSGWNEVAKGLGGVWPALAVVSVGALGAFLPHEGRRPGESAGWRWLCLWALAGAGICLIVMGALGAELTLRAPLPFFLALQGLGFSGGFQRLEAMGTAAWALSDIALIGLAALVGVEIAGGRKGWAWPILAGAVVGGWFLPNAAVAGAQGILFGANVALGIVIPGLVAVTGGKPTKDSGQARLEGAGYCGQEEN